MTTTPTDPQSETELVPTDDTIIGTAFRWSLLVIVIGAGVVVGAILWTKREHGDEEIVIEKDPGVIAGLDRETGALPRVRFADVTEAAGIDFVHENGARGDRMLPETMGGGAAFLDHDGDGDQDLLLVNATNWPWDGPAAPAATSVLYRNDGTGRFEDVTAEAGLDDPFYGTGVACGDFDGDGRVDLYLTAVGPNRLYRNIGGAFELVADAGVAGAPDAWSTGAAFLDHDHDGDLDLFVCNYVRWSRTIDLELNYTLNGTDRAYGPPTNFRGHAPRTSIATTAAASSPTCQPAGRPARHQQGHRPGRGQVARHDGADRLRRQRPAGRSVRRQRHDPATSSSSTEGDCVFREAGSEHRGRVRRHGQLDRRDGDRRCVDFRNDDDLALAMGNFANEMTSFYVSAGQLPACSPTTRSGEGVGAPSRLRT